LLNDSDNEVAIQLEQVVDVVDVIDVVHNESDNEDDELEGHYSSELEELIWSIDFNI